MLAVTLKVFWPILLTPETLRFFCKRFPIMWYLGFVLRSFRGHIVWSESQWTKQNALDFSYNIFFFFMFLTTLGLSTRSQEQKLHLFPSIRCCSVHEDTRGLPKATAFPLPRATAAQRNFKSTSSPAISKRLWVQ